MTPHPPPLPDGRPTPGSPDARAAGCLCAVGDNAGGWGAWGSGSGPADARMFWQRADCPMHGIAGLAPATPAAAPGAPSAAFTSHF